MQLLNKMDQEANLVQDQALPHRSIKLVVQTVMKVLELKWTQKTISPKKKF